MTCSWPSSLSCERTAPVLLSLASVSRMNNLVKSGKVKIGVDVNLWRSSSNATWQASVQWNCAARSVSSWNGPAIFAKS